MLQEVKHFFRRKILLNRTYIRDKYERKSAKRKDEKFNGGRGDGALYVYRRRQAEKDKSFARS